MEDVKTWSAAEIKAYFWAQFQIGRVTDVTDLAERAARDGLTLTMLSLMLRGARRDGHIEETAVGKLMCLSRPSGVAAND